MIDLNWQVFWLVPDPAYLPIRVRTVVFEEMPVIFLAIAAIGDLQLRG